MHKEKKANQNILRNVLILIDFIPSTAVNKSESDNAIGTITTTDASSVK